MEGMNASHGDGEMRLQAWHQDEPSLGHGRALATCLVAGRYSASSQVSDLGQVTNLVTSVSPFVKWIYISLSYFEDESLTHGAPSI